MQPPPPGYGPPPGYPPPGYPPGSPYGAPPPFHPQQPDPAGEVTRSANLAVGLSAGSLLCCLPLGVAGVYFGVKTFRLASERGVRAPGYTIMAFILAGLSLLGTAGALVAYARDVKQRDEDLKTAEAKTKGKLGGEKLDASVACAAFEEQLLKGLYEHDEFVKNVKCSGWKQEDDRGTIDKVTFDSGGHSVVVRGCFARAHRWFAAGYVPSGSSCPDVDLGVDKGKKKQSDAELDAEEDDLRKKWKSASDVAIADDAVSKLKKAADLVDDDHARKTCNDLNVDDVTVPTVDADAIAKGAKNKGWEFLTSSSIADALDASLDSSKRAAGAQTLLQASPPLVVVYSSSKRALPVPDDSKFFGGGFRGWMSVVDLSKNTIVCDAPLTFESSKSIDKQTSNFASDEEQQKELIEDLAKNYGAAANAAIKDVSGGKLDVATP
jgi:hypothetical protein